MNIYSDLYELGLDQKEKLEFLDKLYSRLLEHRYRYYGLDAPVLEDFEYDWLERYYNKKAEAAGVKLMEMVDFNSNDPLAIEAKNRVDSETDHHSLWLAEMKSVWDRIGKPAKEENVINLNPNSKDIDIKTQEGLDLLKIKAKYYGYYSEQLKVIELIEEIENLKQSKS